MVLYFAEISGFLLKSCNYLAKRKPSRRFQCLTFDKLAPVCYSGPTYPWSNHARLPCPSVAITDFLYTFSSSNWFSRKKSLNFIDEHYFSKYAASWVCFETSSSLMFSFHRFSLLSAFLCIFQASYLGDWVIASWTTWGFEKVNLMTTSPEKF